MEKDIDTLCREHKNMVYKVVNKYKPYKSDIEDYVQEGFIALIKAFYSYKEGDAKFTTYAYQSINNRVYNYDKRVKTGINSSNTRDIFLKMRNQESLTREQQTIVNMMNSMDIDDCYEQQDCQLSVEQLVEGKYLHSMDSNDPVNVACRMISDGYSWKDVKEETGVRKDKLRRLFAKEKI